MKVRKNEAFPTFVLELSAREAKWLRGYVQNLHIGLSQEEALAQEDQESREMRKTLFDMLSKVGGRWVL